MTYARWRTDGRRASQCWWWRSEWRGAVCPAPDWLPKGAGEGGLGCRGASAAGREWKGLWRARGATNAESGAVLDPRLLRHQAQLTPGGSPRVGKALQTRCGRGRAVLPLCTPPQPTTPCENRTRGPCLGSKCVGMLLPLHQWGARRRARRPSTSPPHPRSPPPLPTPAIDTCRARYPSTSPGNSYGHARSVNTHLPCLKHRAHQRLRRTRCHPSTQPDVLEALHAMHSTRGRVHAVPCQTQCASMYSHWRPRPHDPRGRRQPLTGRRPLPPPPLRLGGLR